MVAIQIQECSQLIQVFCMRQSKCLYIIYTGNFLNRVQTIFVLQNESFSFVYYQRCMQTSGHATIFLLHCFSQIIRNNHPTASNYAPNKWMTYKPAVHISFKKMCKTIFKRLIQLCFHGDRGSQECGYTYKLAGNGIMS